MHENMNETLSNDRAHKRPRIHGQTHDKTSQENHVQDSSQNQLDTDCSTIIVNHMPKLFVKGLLDTAESLRMDYMQAKPFAYTKIKSLIDPILLHNVKKEIQDHIHFTLKETDIYKVYQTGDLANLDGLTNDDQMKLCSVYQLRNALYSHQFRTFVSQVTGCGPLSGTIQDMSINSYRQGCHLLNHDDVIGTRCVSYILYLTDLDWQHEFGGGLELYACEQRGRPNTDPVLVIPPVFNQFIMFAVQPGYSFHAVKEVVVNKDRLSISGWFHVPQVGEPGYSQTSPQWAVESGKASLEQLVDDCDQGFKDYSPLIYQPVNGDDQWALTADDRSIMKEFINPEYLTDKTIQSINNTFGDQSHIQLISFLNKETAELVKKHILTVEEDVSCCVGPGWHIHGSPVKQRHLVLDPDAQIDNDGSSGYLLSTKLQDLVKLFQSQAWLKWVYQVTGIAPTAQHIESRRFRPGLDYTLASAHASSSVLDVTLNITPVQWCTTMGGYECYVDQEEEDDPAVYRSSSDAPLLTVESTFNVLNLVVRDSGVMRFVKYVSKLAPMSRWDVTMEYLYEEV